MRHFAHARIANPCVVLLAVACFKIPSADGTGVRPGVLIMLNPGESTEIGADISRIEKLAIEGGQLLEEKDYEGAFIAWLGVHRLAERAFGSEDQVSVDALRLAITSLDLIERINHAERLLEEAFGPDVSDPDTMSWFFRDHRPQQRMQQPPTNWSNGRVRARRVRRGPASNSFNSHIGQCNRRLRHD